MKNKFLRNKKGATYSSLIWVIVLTALFVFVIGIISVETNSKYGTTGDLTFGMANDASLTALKNYADTIKTDVETGQSSYSSLGILQLTTLPHLIGTILTLTWNFVSGGFIERIVGIMNLGDYSNMVMVAFRVIYFVLLGLILMKILTRTNV
jgi:hypothetical protein